MSLYDSATSPPPFDTPTHPCRYPLGDRSPLTLSTSRLSYSYSYSYSSSASAASSLRAARCSHVSAPPSARGPSRAAAGSAERAARQFGQTSAIGGALENSGNITTCDHTHTDTHTPFIYIRVVCLRVSGVFESSLAVIGTGGP
eukprot:1182547-Prorocentrum_minimum.AAC.2